MKRVHVILITAVASLAIGVFSTPNVFGQATFGNISGTVTDPAGAAIPNAQVTITDTERGEVVQTKTNSSGNYSQTHLLAGQYKIVITAPGFSVPLPGEATTCVTVGIVVSICAPTWVRPESAERLAAVPAPFSIVAPLRLIVVAASEAAFWPAATV